MIFYGKIFINDAPEESVEERKTRFSTLIFDNPTSGDSLGLVLETRDKLLRIPDEQEEDDVFSEELLEDID